MDYKDVVKAIKFSLRYLELTGLENKIYCYLATESSYKDSQIDVSYSELGEVLGISKSSVKKSIDSLIEKKLIVVVDDFVGRAKRVYKIRSEDDLRIFYEKEVINKKHETHYAEEQKKFGDMLRKIYDIGDDCKDDYEKCKEDRDVDTGEGYCAMHGHFLREAKNSEKYREYLVWRKENPQPSHKIKTINGKEVTE